MQTYFSSPSLQEVSLFKEKLFSFLTIERKKDILLIVSIALGFFTACCIYALHYYKFKSRDLSKFDRKKLDPKIDQAQRVARFKKKWQSIVVDGGECESEGNKLKLAYQNLSVKPHIDHSPYSASMGFVWGVPATFGMWMPGVAFIASLLATKKNIEGLFVCQTIEAFASGLKTFIENSDKNQRAAFILGVVGSGMGLSYPLCQENFPQHKVVVLAEKKEGKLTIALLDSQPGSVNVDICPSHLTDQIWNGYSESGKFNNQELVFRAILKVCRSTPCDPRLLYSQVIQQKIYGCVIFSLQNAFAYLRDPDFFSRITCSTEKVILDAKTSIEIMNQLPPEYMVGVQSIQLLNDYKNQVGQGVCNQNFPGKQKSLQYYLDKYLFSSRNHYITKKNFKYLNLLVQSLSTLKESEIKQIMLKTLITKVDKELFVK